MEHVILNNLGIFNGRENKSDETNRYDKLSCGPMDLIRSTMTRWYWLTRGESRGFITRITIDVYFYDICKSIIFVNINDFVNIIVTILLLRELLHYLFTFNAEDVLTPN